MATNTPAPRFPEPPIGWSVGFMQAYTRTLVLWINQVVAQTRKEVGDTAVRAVTASTSVGLSDGLVLVDTTTGNVVVTLPDATTVLGREFIVKRTTAGVNALTVSATSGNIDAAASYDISVQHEAHTFKSDGTNFWVVSSQYGP